MSVDKVYSLLRQTPRLGFCTIEAVDQGNRIESELARRILVSEKTRSLILAWTLSVVTPCLFVFMLVAAHRMGSHVLNYMLPIFVIFLAGISFEWWAVWKLGQAIRQNQPPQRFRFYLNALAEMLIPALVILIAADNLSAVNPINGPFVYSFFIFIILSPLRLDFGLCCFTGFLAAAAYATLLALHWGELTKVWDGPATLMYFSYGSRVVIFLMGGVVAAFVTQRIRATLFETINQWAEQERIIGIFGQHVSPAVVNLLLDRSTDLSEQRSVCVLVLDIRNFTTFSEHRSADEVVAYLNTLWGHAVHIVNQHQGFVNKFLGDGFLAVFGAPFALGNNAREALAAAREILDKVEQLVAEQQLPPTQIGMALHAGEVIVGNVGSSEKKEYTVIGDVVNVAFRIEALNKNFGSKLLVSESVTQATGSEGFEPLPPIQVKGRDEPVALYRVA